jgi:hypothetical protein
MRRIDTGYERIISLAVPDYFHPLDGRYAFISAKKAKTTHECSVKHGTRGTALALSMIHSPAEPVAFSTPEADSPTRHQDKTESGPDYKINYCFDIRIEMVYSEASAVTAETIDVELGSSFFHVLKA